MKDLSPPTSLGVISPRLVDRGQTERLAPLLFISPTQVNFEVPAGTTAGDVTLEIVSAPVRLPSSWSASIISHRAFSLTPFASVQFTVSVSPCNMPGLEAAGYPASIN